MEIISSIKGGYDSWLSSVSEINRLTIDQMEKITEKQMDSTKYYTDLGLQHLKGIQNIQGIDDIKNFAGESVTLTGTVAKKVMEDSQDVVAMSTEFKNKLVDTVKNGLRRQQASGFPDASPVKG